MFFCTRKTEQSELCSDVTKLSQNDTGRRMRTREKLVALRWRYARVYKGIAAASETFHERGGTTARVTDFSFFKEKSERSKVRSDVVTRTRIELVLPP